MSSYENYSRTARRYDDTRIPVGVEIIIGCLAHGQVPLGQQHLLDAGCGTGNYSAALLPRVGRISAVDLNDDMLNRARNKLADEGQRGRIDFHRASIDALPFAEATFDGILINQVLHHLAHDSDGDGDGDADVDGDYSLLRKVFAEFARVLKPDGAVVVNTCSRRQLRRGFWYYHLIPEQIVRMCGRHAPLDQLRRIMEEAGIAWQQRIVPVDALMQGEAYFNPRGPLDKAWRDGDSMWGTVPEQTLNAVIARLNDLEKSGKLESYLRQHDAERKHIGQLSFLYGRLRSVA